MATVPSLPLLHLARPDHGTAVRTLDCLQSARFSPSLSLRLALRSLLLFGISFMLSRFSFRFLVP